MNSLVKYLVEGILIEEKKQVTVLYPGGFKPPHGGHFELAKRYADLSNVLHVIVLIGPETRDDITKNQSVQVWKELTKNEPKILIQTTEEGSPLKAAYKYIEKAKPGMYTLASSKKEDDYKRVQQFIQGHSESGKYKRPGITVVELNLDTEPVKYDNRSDKAQKYVAGKSENGKGISASVLRADLKNNDKEAFATNYPNVSDKAIIDKIFNLLKKDKTQEQVALMEEGPKSSISLNNLLRDIKLFDVQNIEGKELLLCGGAAGHLAHPYEDINLSFENIKNIIDLSLSGKVEQAQEKLDGQNLMITYKNGQVRAARNKGQLKNFGENSLTVNQVKDMFTGRDTLQAAFGEAVHDLSIAINRLTREQKIKFFNNGEKFLNLEILYPSTQNIIPYGATQIRFHNIKTYDDAGNVINEDIESAQRLEGALRQVQAQKQKTYTIKASNPANIKKSKDYEVQKSELSNIVDKIVKEYKLTQTQTIGDYITAWWKKYITEKAKTYNYNIPEQVLNTLIERWGFTNKQMNIGELRRLINNGEFSSWIADFDKTEVQSTKKTCVKPLEILFLKLGVYVLQNVQNLVAINPDAAVSSIKSELKNAIDQIKQAAQTPSSEDDNVGLKLLKRELTRLKDIGGFKAILPTEGIVFKYDGKLYKLTGAFPPVNTILGYLRY